MIQAQDPRGWMQIQISPSRSPDGRASPSTQVKSAILGGTSEGFSSERRRGKTRPYPLQSSTKEARNSSRRSASTSRTVKETRVRTKIDRFDPVIVANLHPLAPGRGGEGLIEVVSRNLVGLGRLPREDVGKAEPLVVLARQEESSSLGLVPSSDDRIE